MKFQDWLRNRRTSAAVTQEELAAELGCSTQSVVHWENGISEPGAKNIRQLADFFDIETAEIVTIIRGSE